MEVGKTYFVEAADYGKIIADGKALPPMKKSPEFLEEKGAEIGAVVKIEQAKDGTVSYKIVTRCATMKDVTYA